ncbi:hypothetical protein D3C72_1585770 [compost metagenome]
MAGVQRDDLLWLHPLRHAALRLRRNHAVQVGYLVPARLRLPCGRACLVFETPSGDGFLRDGHHQCIGLAKVVTEAFLERAGIEPQEAVLVGPDMRRAGRWRLLREDAAQALALVRRERGDKDQARHVRRVARAADHCPAVRMPDQQYRAVLGSRQPGGTVDVVRQRGQWILHRRNVIAPGVKQRDDFPPVRGISPGAMH